MHQTAQFSSGVLVRASAVLGPVAAAACFHSQLEMFLPPRPAVRACWLKGRCSHQMLQDTANIFLFFFLSFFPPHSPALLVHIVTGLNELPLGPKQASPPHFLLSVKKGPDKLCIYICMHRNFQRHIEGNGLAECRCYLRTTTI